LTVSYIVKTNWFMYRATSIAPQIDSESYSVITNWFMYRTTRIEPQIDSVIYSNNQLVYVQGNQD
jgi:hypothetical protein